MEKVYVTTEMWITFYDPVLGISESFVLHKAEMKLMREEISFLTIHDQI